MNKNMTIELKPQNHCQICYDKFRYPLTGLVGTLELSTMFGVFGT